MANFEKTLAQVNKKADKAFEVFNKAQATLEKETGNLHNYVASLDEEIDRLITLRDTALKSIKKNQSVIDKFLDFLGFND